MIREFHCLVVDDGHMTQTGLDLDRFPGYFQSGTCICERLEKGDMRGGCCTPLFGAVSVH